MSAIARWFKRRWMLKQMDHYIQCAEFERAKASESRRKAYWYEREFLLTQSRLRAVCNKK